MTVVGKSFGSWTVINADATGTTWKRFYGLIRADKEQSSLTALQLHPELAAKLARRQDVGRAEALLIARARELLAASRR